MNTQQKAPYAFQQPDSLLTLREGLEEYYRVNPGFTGTDDFLGQSRQTVIDHDVCHVVFGVGTSSKEELMIETITAFGCQVPIKKIPEITQPKFFVAIIKHFGLFRLIRRFVLTTPKIAETLFMVKRMKKRWPHFSYAEYMDMPLKDIREEFGINIVKA